MIREVFDATNDVSSAFAAYVALSELASNKSSEEVTTTRGLIAHKAGLSVRKLSDIFRKLVAANLLKITPNFLEGSDGKAKAPSTYTLLNPSGNGCLTLSNGCLSLGKDGNQPSLPDYRRKREEIREEIAKKTKAKADSAEEVRAYAQSIGLTAEDGDWFFNSREGNGWMNDGKPIRNWQRTMSAWKCGNIFPSQKSALNNRGAAVQPKLKRVDL
jgi:hypothetical protein